MSHELRTPLNAIIGFSEIMQNAMFGPIGSDKYSEYADDIHYSGSYLLAFINDILDMSRIEAGQFRVTPEPMNAAEILRETMMFISVQAASRNVTVKVDAPDSLLIEADKIAFKQVLINLLSNAQKFAKQDGEICVRAKLAGNALRLSIRDNGCGIPREALSKLGQPFTQVAEPTTRHHPGSGLGLAISRSLVELHGGRLRIVSRLGEGTIVHMTLPQPPNSDVRSAA